MANGPVLMPTGIPVAQLAAGTEFHAPANDKLAGYFAKPGVPIEFPRTMELECSVEVDDAVIRRLTSRPMFAKIGGRIYRVVSATHVDDGSWKLGLEEVQR